MTGREFMDSQQQMLVQIYKKYGLWDTFSEEKKMKYDPTYVPEYVGYSEHVQELNIAVETAKEEGRQEAFSEIIEGTSVLTSLPVEQLHVVSSSDGTVLSGAVSLPDSDSVVETSETVEQGKASKLKSFAALFVIYRFLSKGRLF